MDFIFGILVVLEFMFVKFCIDECVVVGCGVFFECFCGMYEDFVNVVVKWYCVDV